jgi:hypothetical protein
MIPPQRHVATVQVLLRGLQTAALHGLALALMPHECHTLGEHPTKQQPSCMIALHAYLHLLDIEITTAALSITPVAFPIDPSSKIIPKLESTSSLERSIAMRPVISNCELQSIPFPLMDGPAAQQ